MPSKIPPEALFWQKVDLKGPYPESVPHLGRCWLWTASTDERGYGQFRVRPKMHKAYRWCYEHLVGPVPEGLELDHLCRTVACVNPAHLEPVTHAENCLRGMSPPALHARKTHCQNGHAFDDENTYRDKHGRRCRTCMRIADRARRPRRRVGAA